MLARPALAPHATIGMNAHPPPAARSTNDLLQAHVARGDGCLARGDFVEAEAAFAAALRLAPQQPQLQLARALALQGLGRVDAALALLREAANCAPGDAAILNALGSLLGEVGEVDAALATLQRACELAPGFAAAWFNLGKCRVLRGEIEVAQAPLERALALAPALASARYTLAEVLMMRGRSAESAAQYRELLRHEPRAGLAWWGLANLKAVRFNAADVARLEALLQRRDVAADEQLAARFALARALDDEGRDEAAFAAYVAANEQARPAFPWQAAAFDDWMAQVVAAFDAAPSPPDAGLGDEVIFIVGLPRSASTLTEQILAAHSQVEGASELGDLGAVIAAESRRRGAPFPQWVGQLDATDWRRLGEQYLQRTARWRRQRPRFTDKMPGNWVYSAAIAHMLPAARIVHCRRDAVETCWSCFRQIFWAAHNYSYDLMDLAVYWRVCDRSMRHWQGRWPARIRDQVYESLLAEPEAQTRVLLEFCGLPFEAACLRPHEATRSVRTASAAQVREPLRRDTARTARYGALLDPLRAALSASPR